MTSSKGPRRSTPVHDNFLEALRDLGKSVVSDATDHISRAISADIPESFGLATPLSGTLSPNESLSLSQLHQAEAAGERRAETQFNTRLKQIREEERLLYLRSENETKIQIKALLQEIQLLAKSTAGLASEVQIAAFQAPVSPGVYHQTFFERLRGLLKTLRQKIQDSQHWLATTNARAAKRSYYWSQVGRSGSKFLLSQERYMVTSTG